MKASDVIRKYIKYFEKRGHKKIANASLVPENDPTTLFTSSGMQPLVPYLLGEVHPAGNRLVNVQNAFRAVDIDEVGDNRHTTFFRMLGNWSLGDYFKTDQLTWIFDFLIDPREGLGLDPHKLFVTVFEGEGKVSKDTDSIEIWKTLFQAAGVHAKEGERIFPYGAEKNWWSRAGVPSKMPVGEPGGPDSEIFYDFGEERKIHEKSLYKDQKCHVNCDCGRYIEICNSVFMQYQKKEDGILAPLPSPNVDFGGGLERMLLAIDDQTDGFKTNLFAPIIQVISEQTKQKYIENQRDMRIVADHFTASAFIALAGVIPSNKEQGYIMRRLIRRGLDHYMKIGGKDIVPVLEAIVAQYVETDPIIEDQYEKIKGIIIEEIQKYERTKEEAKKYITKKQTISGKARIVKEGDELMGVTEITADDAFILYTTRGLSPTQIKSLGYTFNDQAFAERMEEHQKLSRAGGAKKFAGGLADHSELTIKGHTATHLMHQAIRDVLGDKVHQSGSNITSERVRFDYNYDKKLTPDEIKRVEDIVNEKIKDNLSVHFEMMPLARAKEIGAIGLFDEKYGDTVKVYFMGGPNPYADVKSSDALQPSPQSSPRGRGSSKEVNTNDRAYSVEFCGGPHVEFTDEIKSFKIIKEEGLGRGMRRIYAKVQ